MPHPRYLARELEKEPPQPKKDTETETETPLRTEVIELVSSKIETPGTHPETKTQEEDNSHGILAKIEVSKTDTPATHHKTEMPGEDNSKIEIQETPLKIVAPEKDKIKKQDKYEMTVSRSAPSRETLKLLKNLKRYPTGRTDRERERKEDTPETWRMSENNLSFLIFPPGMQTASLPIKSQIKSMLQKFSENSTGGFHCQKWRCG